MINAPRFGPAADPQGAPGEEPGLADLLPDGRWLIVAEDQSTIDEIGSSICSTAVAWRPLTLETAQLPGVLRAIDPRVGVLLIASPGSWALPMAALADLRGHRGPVLIADMTAAADAKLVERDGRPLLWIRGPHGRLLVQVIRRMRPDRPTGSGAQVGRSRLARVDLGQRVQDQGCLEDMERHNPMLWKAPRELRPRATRLPRELRRPDPSSVIRRAMRGEYQSLRAADASLLASHVHDDVLSLLTEQVEPGTARDAERLSVRLRRAALRAHGGVPAPDRDGLCRPVLPASILLVSRRPDFLPRALATALAQDHRPLEVVVVAHGFQPPAVPHDAPADVPVTLLSVEADRTLGSALQEATGAASGTVVTKLDDDDLYGPHHVSDLVLALRYSRAVVVGKTSEFVYLGGLDVTVRRRVPASERFGGHIAGGTITLARADLRDLGGWSPVPRAVDSRLLDEVVRSGGSIYRTHGHGFVFNRHGSGHTYPADAGYFLRKAVEQRHGLDLKFAGVSDD